MGSNWQSSGLAFILTPAAFSVHAGSPVQSNFGGNYIQGSAWQYSWYMPHDNAGLVIMGDINSEL